MNYRFCIISFYRYVLSFFAYDQDEIHSSTTMVLSLDDTSTTTTGTSPWTPTWTPTIPPDPTTTTPEPSTEPPNCKILEVKEDRYLYF